MEKHWDAQQEAHKQIFMEGEEEEAEEDVKRDDDDIRSGCFIYRVPFASAIIAKCKDYHCDSCAPKRCSVEKARPLAPSPPSLHFPILKCYRDSTWGAWFNLAFLGGELLSACDWLPYLPATHARHLQRGRIAARTGGGGAKGGRAYHTFIFPKHIQHPYFRRWKRSSESARETPRRTTSSGSRANSVCQPPVDLLAYQNIKIEVETQAEAEVALKAQCAIEQRHGAWKELPGNVS